MQRFLVFVKKPKESVDRYARTTTRYNRPHGDGGAGTPGEATARCCTAKEQLQGVAKALAAKNGGYGERTAVAPITIGGCCEAASSGEGGPSGRCSANPERYQQFPAALEGTTGSRAAPAVSYALGKHFHQRPDATLAEGSGHARTVVTKRRCRFQGALEHCFRHAAHRRTVAPVLFESQGGWPGSAGGRGPSWLSFPRLMVPSTPRSS